MKQECTKVTDTICECLRGFVAWDEERSTCKCDIGFELINEGTWRGHKILLGMFKKHHLFKNNNERFFLFPCQNVPNAKTDISTAESTHAVKSGKRMSPVSSLFCLKLMWYKQSYLLFTALYFILQPRCESGEKMNGTPISDVICNELGTNSTSNHPREGAHIQKMLTTTMTTTTTTTAAPGHKVTPKPNGKIEPSPNSNTGNHIGETFVGISLRHNLQLKNNINPK